MAIQLDLLSIYALADASHSLEKDSWRDFLGVIAPVLLECSAEDVEYWSEESSHCSVEELTSAAEKLLSISQDKKAVKQAELAETLVEENLQSETKANRKLNLVSEMKPVYKLEVQDKEHIPVLYYMLFSGELALELGLGREFGLAAFVEPTLATKVHQLTKPNFGRKVKSKSRIQAKMMGKWLERFTKLQHDEEFLKSVLFWKELLEPYFATQAEVLQDEEIEEIDEIDEIDEVG